MAASHHSRARRAGALTAGLTAGGALIAAQRRITRAVAADPENRVLSDPPTGRPLTARSADGTLLHVEQFGSENAPAIVLAHGWTESLTYWTYEILELSRDFRVIAFDLRGHDRSARAATGDYSLDRFGEDIEAVLGATVSETEPAVVVGHSLGAMSIAAWAAHHPVQRRVRAAAFLNTGLSNLLAEQLLVRYPGQLRRFADPISRHAFLGSRAPLPRFSSPLQHAAIRYFAFGPAATPAQIAFYERMLISCPPRVRGAVGLAIADMDLVHALAKLTVPTLVIAGADDRLTPPSHAHGIAAALPHVTRVVVLEDTAHMAPLERPAEISVLLRELAGVGKRSEHPAVSVAE